MNGYRDVILWVGLLAAAPVTWAGEMEVRAEVVSRLESPVTVLDRFPADVDFAVEALYPRRNNQARARIEIRYSCVDPETGGRYVPCYITLDPPVARADSGGHIDSLHAANRPTGTHQPAQGNVDEYGYFYSTYHASEVGGIVDSVINCTTLWVVCRSGTVSFGVGIQTLEDLGEGPGYTLKGARAPHLSNHWGVPGFLAAVRNVADLFEDDYPNSPLLYNDVSLQYGGLFDVETRTAVGYDWTPPHKSHRLGTNMDIGIPHGNAQRALLLRLYQTEGVAVLQEDVFHWHLTY